MVVVPQPAYITSNFPQNMVCSSCHAQILTAVEYENGTMTWILCVALFFITGICCFIPFLIDQTKDTIHSCPSCKAFIGRKNAI